MSEFDLIRRHFTRPTSHTELAGGDDGALLVPRAGMQIVVSTDMLVAGTHFFADTAPGDLGWKAAAVNISDMAAMGAQPRWMFLALALPHGDEAWIEAFADGFAACCEQFAVDWAGGDTTRGPLNLCPTILGEVPAGQAVQRDGAQPGDDIWVSGWPGLAHLGLRHLRDGLPLAGDWRELCLRCLHRPHPRVDVGIALRSIATAMLDVSDGLLGDLAHILCRSEVGARLEEARLPLTPALAACNDGALARQAMLSGGDDYELLFCAPPAQRAAVEAVGERLGVPLSRIGECVEESGMQMCFRDGSFREIIAAGYDHFTENPAGPAPSP